MADMLQVGWKKVSSYSLLVRLNAAVEKVPNLGRAELIGIACMISGYRNPSDVVAFPEPRLGLTFKKSSGSVLIVLPRALEVPRVPVALHVMGDVTDDDRNAVVNAYYGGFMRYVISKLAR